MTEPHFVDALRGIHAKQALTTLLLRRCDDQVLRYRPMMLLHCFEISPTGAQMHEDAGRKR